MSGNDNRYDEYLLKSLLEVSQEIQKVLVAIDKDMSEKDDIKELLGFISKLRDEISKIGNVNEKGQGSLKSLLEHVLRQIDTVLIKIRDVDKKTAELLEHRNTFRQGDYSDTDLVKLGKHVKDANSMHRRSLEFDNRLHDIESIILSMDTRIQSLVDFIEGKNDLPGAKIKLDHVFDFIEWASNIKGKMIFLFVFLMALFSLLAGAPSIYKTFFSP